jgi:hypothetical protein
LLMTVMGDGGVFEEEDTWQKYCAGRSKSRVPNAALDTVRRCVFCMKEDMDHSMDYCILKTRGHGYRSLDCPS